MAAKMVALPEKGRGSECLHETLTNQTFYFLKSMLFDPLYYGDRLHFVNVKGDVGIVTLWSQITQVLRLFIELDIDLNPDTSRIAVIGNLYGNGLPHLLRNLLWNPQIGHLLILGQNLSSSREELIEFFQAGIEPVEFLGSPSFRIVGTNRVIDGLATPEDFARKPLLVALDRLSDESTKQGIISFFSGLPEPDKIEYERVNIELPKTDITRYPSEPRSHTILRRTPLEAWDELIFRLVRFGHRNRLKKGERIELQNVKIIIEEPIEESDERVRELGFDPDKFRNYQKCILNPIKPSDLDYTYGNRLRGYFDQVVTQSPMDTLEQVIKHLSDDPESRHCYISLWDTAHDLVAMQGCPCLVSLFFRRFEGRLTLTATFRTHNAASAWPENVWGLIAIQRHVASSVNMERGALTVFSHSISVDPDSLEKTKLIADAKKSDEMIDPATGKRTPRMDHNGEFTVTVDESSGEIVVQHSYKGVRLGEYRGKRAEQVEKQLARDGALSEISHALYLGREIARAEMRLKKQTTPHTTDKP